MAKQNVHSLFKSGWNYLTCLFFLKKKNLLLKKNQIVALRYESN